MAHRWNAATDGEATVDRMCQAEHHAALERFAER
jgi:hypothetical protein